MATEGVGLKSARRFTRWYIVAAILFIVVGVFAILEPALAGLGVALLVGWLLVFGGIAHFVSAFEGGGTQRVFLQVLAGVVFVLGGLYLLAHPLLALGTLTLMLAGVIFAAGIFEIMHWYRHRGAEASGWLLFNGIVTLLLGGLILFRWPSSSVWAIGTLVGVNLLLTGVSRLMFGLAGRRLLGRVAT
jgi:uncharacterized membrane protein HdeD (DUF308 family)